jgi:glutamyl-Q tRNA(Asp) synthetase
MGSLVTALASFFDVKVKGGQWYVRIDDLDPPREDAAASGEILNSLQAHGLHGDRVVDYQSGHAQRYREALNRLTSHLFYCTCSRKSLADHAVYPGTCRGNTAPIADAAIRLRVSATPITFVDAIVGVQTVNLAQDCGDFIVRRRDGLWAYNLATAVDDGTDATHVLRGQDLLGVTAQQIYLMELLELTVPAYSHIPLLCFADGTKLSKQTHAPPLDDNRAALNLRAALHYLGLAPPAQPAWLPEQWVEWGLAHWKSHELPPQLPPYTPT